MLDLNVLNAINKTNSNTSLNTNNINSIQLKNNIGFSDVLKTQQTSLDSIFQQASNTYNVPINLIKAVAKAESNFNASAVSSAGAQGVMQLMPKTAQSLGVQDSFDAEDNIMGGTKYLSQLLNKYDNNVTLALAGYNAGMGNVAKYGGVPPFEETKNYIEKVMNYAKIDIDTSSYKLQNKNSNYKTIENSISDFTEYTSDEFLYFLEMLTMHMTSSLDIGFTEELMRQRVQQLY